MSELINRGPFIHKIKFRSELVPIFEEALVYSFLPLPFTRPAISVASSSLAHGAPNIPLEKQRISVEFSRAVTLDNIIV